MQAIAALHAQLSAATEQLDFANARLEFLRNDNKVVEETKNLQWEELNRLTELLAATADDETTDAQLLAEQEAETAALEARFHLRQLQLEAVPLAFQKLATKFVDVSQRYTLEIDAMMSLAIKEDFWRNQIAATTRDIGLLRRQHKDTVARQQMARQREEMALKAEAEEEENSLSMIEACLTVYEKKLQSMPMPREQSSSSSSAAAAMPPCHSRTTPTSSIYQTAAKPSETTLPHHPSRPTKSRPYEESLGLGSSHPHNLGNGQTMPPADPSFPPPGSGGLQHTTHTTLVTHRVIEEVEVVDTPVAVGSSGYGSTGYPPAPSSFQHHHHHRYHDSRNDNHPPQQQHHHQHQHQHQQQLQQHPHPHGDSYEVAERPWYQVMKRRRSVETSSTSSDRDPRETLHTQSRPYPSSSSSSSSSSSLMPTTTTPTAANSHTPSSSSSSSSGGTTTAGTANTASMGGNMAPSFRSGLDLLLEAEDGRL